MVPFTRPLGTLSRSGRGVKFNAYFPLAPYGERGQG